MITFQKFDRNGAVIFVSILLLMTGLRLYSADPENGNRPVMQYIVSMPEPSAHYFHVELFCRGWNEDTINLRMPRWSPGYYQIMDYAKGVSKMYAYDHDKKAIPLKQLNQSSWEVIIPKGKAFNLSYDVKADRKFVATSYLDTTHGYIIPAATFLYVSQHINTPVSVKVIPARDWDRFATGLESVSGAPNEFYSPDFDFLYDCPILVGNLEELRPFYVKGVKHRFIGYNLGDFDREKFITKLQKAVQAGVDIIGDVPYKNYTFIAIGPGMGGIEHLNNTTVSFFGKGLDDEDRMNRVMNFLAHEYFHNYNVKRIRPYELGPFDYDRENKTNLLWESEGLTVYYEYLIVKRAGLINEATFFHNIEGNINTFENTPGRSYQSLTEASYMTWSEGPFGNQGEDANKSISYYEKGPLAGLILDLAIRNATLNKKSLDDVLRLVYREYYRKLQRGFTDAEFQQACEMVAGTSLANEFEYIYTTRELDYTKYLSYAGLKISESVDKEKGKRKFVISKMDNTGSLQTEILKSWEGEQP